MRFIRFRHNQATAGLFVETMHNSRSLHSADSRKGRKMMQESIHQGVLPVARTGMNHQTGWLIDHNQVVIFVKNIDWDGLGLMVDLFRGWFVDLDAVSGADEITRPGGRAV